MRVILVEPDKRARVAEIDEGLESLQKAVGGYIEAIYPYDDPVALICNEEGKINGMKLNRALYSDEGELYDIVAGTFVVVGLSESDFDSLPDDLMQKYKALFNLPERFARINDDFIAVKFVPPSSRDNRDERLLFFQSVISLRACLEKKTN